MLKGQEADICIVAEGSYPFNLGGVAEWVHQLIHEHSNLTFHILTLMPPHPDLTMRYKLPKNVVGNTVYIVQDLPLGSYPIFAPKETWPVIGDMLKGIIESETFKDFDPVLNLFRKHPKMFGKRILSESMGAWDCFLDIYKEKIPSGPFKSYFGTIYTLSCSLFSIMRPPLPKAKIFHALCTGYAGFILYRAKQELGVPCIVTEQGIYSNERRIEIAMATWIAEMGSLDLALEDKKKTLKDFWLNAFFSLAHVCYLCSDEILSTFDGNREIQYEGGADPKKVRTIVHGIDHEEYASIPMGQKKHPPTIAFVGRIVPIKDIKTFIRACKIVSERMPHVRLWALGSYAEDPEYYQECVKVTESLGLTNKLKFCGQVNLKEYFPEVDLIVLTSLSEAQPLVMLEAGALGIPAVATNVGACHQLLFGSVDEKPNLGQGGIVTPLVDPEATAEAIIQIMSNPEFYKKCSESIKNRMQTHYIFKKEHDEYRKIYNKYLGIK